MDKAFWIEMWDHVRVLDKEALYLFAIIAIAFGMLWYVRRSIGRVRDHRLERWDNIKRFDAFKTGVWTRRKKEQHREKVAERIEQRFSIIQKALVSGIVLVAIAVGSIPFVGTIPSTFISLLLTAFTVVLGIAARPFVENLISGVVISLSNQIRVGDTVIIDGHYGTVEDISVSHTRIKTWDWRRYVIPNSRMLTKEFLSLTLADKTLWAYVEFHVGHGEDFDRVEEIALEAAESCSYHNKGTPQFWIIRMEPHSVVCWLASWAESPVAAWTLKSEMARKLLQAFRKEGIRSHIEFSEWDKRKKILGPLAATVAQEGVGTPENPAGSTASEGAGGSEDDSTGDSSAGASDSSAEAVRNNPAG